jgi:hypothetical protein
MDERARPILAGFKGDIPRLFGTAFALSASSAASAQLSPKSDRWQTTKEPSKSIPVATFRPSAT